MTKKEFEGIRNEMYRQYTYCYDRYDDVPGYHIALNAFDEFAKENQEFLSEFATMRKDFISSDRECVAFMFALDKLGYIR